MLFRLRALRFSLAGSAQLLLPRRPNSFVANAVLRAVQRAAQGGHCAPEHADVPRVAAR